MLDRRIEQTTTFAGTAFAETSPRTKPPITIAPGTQSNPISAGLVICIGLLATFAWMAFLGWAAGKIVGMW
jgi:hypothetical protein